MPLLLNESPPYAHLKASFEGSLFELASLIGQKGKTQNHKGEGEEVNIDEAVVYAVVDPAYPPLG